MSSSNPFEQYRQLGGRSSVDRPSEYDAWAGEVDRQSRRQMREDGRLPSPFRPGSIPWVLYNGARASWLVLRHAWATVLWIVAIVLLGAPVLVLAVLTVLAWPVVFIVDRERSQSSPLCRAFLFVPPVVGDARRLWLVLRRRRAIAEGNQLLRDFRMIPPTDEAIYDSYVDEVTGIWFFDVPVAGATQEAVHAKLLAGLPIVGAADFELRRITNSAWEVDFYPEVRRTALDEPRTIMVPPAVDFETMSVAAFYDERGKSQSLSLSGTSGSLVSGLPGGGKSAFLNEFLVPLLVDDRVNVTVCDGKGGADFESVSDYVDLFWNDDDDLDGMISILEDKQELMRERIKTNKALTGESNFWNSPITPERPVELIVIDEAQNWLEKAGRPKQEKEKLERIEALIKVLIKKGRSAGFHVALASQKPDSSTINTSIRDLCGRRVSFRVTTPEMATMALGAVPEGAPSPTMIPEDRIGGCVIGSDSGELIQARAFYMPERAIESYLAAHGTRKPGNRPGGEDAAEGDLVDG